MKFGIVLCSRCNKARGVRLIAKSATCTQCGKRIDVKKAKILTRLDSEKEVAAAVRNYNTELEGGTEIYARDIRAVEKKEATMEPTRVEKSRDVYTEVIKKLVLITARDEKILAAVKELCRYQGEFTRNDLSEVLKRIGIKGDDVSERYIDKFIENNMIYQPKNGLYRCLDTN